MSRSKRIHPPDSGYAARRQGRLILAGLLWGATVTALIIVPFALAGRTGNPVWIAVPVFVTLAYVAVREAPRCLAFYRSLLPWDWARALAVAGVALATTLGVATVLSLVPSGGLMDWSLGALFKVGGDAGMNGFAVPLTNPWLAVIYTPAAVLALPLLAWWEEDIFRKGTMGLASATRRSTVFGLAHLTAGVTLGACVALGCAGFIFTLAYWRGLREFGAEARLPAMPAWVRRRLLPLSAGPRAAEQYAVFRATQAHLVYNAVGIAAILLASFGPLHT